jgi:hypothetical protein
MKKQGISLILCTLLVGISIGQAQLLTNRSVVKINLSGVAIKSYTVQYERLLSRRSSITLSASLSPNARLPFKQALLDQYGGNDDAKRAIDNTLFTKRIGTLEYRFYMAGHAPTGWYIAPFVRYINMDISQDYTYTPSDGILHHAHLDAGFSAGGAGLLLGYQWMFGKRVGLDLWLLGPFYGTKITANFTGEDPLWPSLKPADIVKLKNDIESTDLPLYTVKANLNLPTILAQLQGSYYGVRSFGLALAYSF